MNTIPLDKLTVVTAIFDLSIRDPNRTRSIDDYMKIGRTLLDLPVNLFIVTDPHLSPIIWQHRRKLGFLDRTFIYTLKLEDSPFYRYHYEIEKLYNNGHRPIGLDPIGDTAYYTILGWTRYWIIQESIRLNPFESNGRMWVDFGLFHLYPNTLKKMSDKLITCIDQVPVDRIKMMILQDTSTNEIEDRSKYYSVRQCRLAAGICCGPDSLLSWMVDAFTVEVENCMQSNYPSLDEIVLNVVYTLNSSKFETYYGDYKDILPNFTGCMGGTLIILNNLNHCITHGLTDRSQLISRYLLNGVENGDLTVDPSIERRLRAELI
jgi:uncharacterized protein HtrL/YibB-like